MNQNTENFKKLRQAFWKVAFIYFSFTPVVIYFLSFYFKLEGILLASLVTGIVLTIELYILWYFLDKNHDIDKKLFPTLGWGNVATLSRGFLIALLAGFTVVEYSEKGFEWLCWGVFWAALIIDIFDGYLARKTKQKTELGEKLDIEFDGLVILIGIILCVSMEKLFSWYIIAGLARFLFIAALFVRKSKNKKICPLPYSTYRHTLAVMMMGVIVMTLFPPIFLPHLHLAAVILIFPFTVVFVQDWLITISVIDTTKESYKTKGRKFCFLYLDILPVISRICLTITLFFISDLVLVFLLIFVILGLFGRIGALASLFKVCLMAVEDPLIITIHVCLSVICLNGPGKLSLWSPEEGRLWKPREGDIRLL